nr:hypothetical protein [Ktedonosporobacter rubrisoli]
MAVSTKAVAIPERVSFARIPDIRPMPGLIQIQLDSFEWFKKEGLRELFAEISPIEDFTGKNLSLEFLVPPNLLASRNTQRMSAAIVIRPMQLLSM